jgi:RNA polymerase sigma-70 factor, ECF subfamily
MNISEEKFLIDKLKDGDISALEIIFNNHYSSLCRYLLLLFKNQLLVEHVAQDIFVYLWEHRQEIQIKTSLESYLYSAGRYKALNQIRNASKRNLINQSVADKVSIEEKSSDAILELKELEQILENAIQKLPDRCQQIFRLSREEEMSYQDIAKILDISVNTVENQMSIALKKLRTVLKPFYIQLLFLS